MTANDVPLTWGQPDNGFEGYRTPGLMIYDALINFDLTSSDKASGLIPGLAESWEVNPADKTKWTFKLRKGVKFHDGSEFNADAVVFNIESLFAEKAPHYSARMVSLVGFRLPAYKAVRKIDDYTVEFETKAPDAFWPYQICYMLIASPKGWEAAGKSWEEFAKKPSGTGPWKLTALKAREFAMREGVDIRVYRIIYEMESNVKEALEGMLRPDKREDVVGLIEVRQTFHVPSAGTIAGCFVVSGAIKRQSQIRLLREGKQVWAGTIGSLKRFKQDASEVKAGYECGILLNGMNDVREGDSIEVITITEVKRTLEQSVA